MASPTGRWIAAWLVGSILIIAKPDPLFWIDLSVALARFYVPLLTALLVHELAHAWVGRKNGLDVLLVGVGPFLFNARTRRLHVVLVSPLQVLCGCATFRAREGDDERLLVGWRRMLLAGPLATLALGLMAFAINAQAGARSVVDGLIGAVGFVALVTGGLSLLPWGVASGRAMDRC